MYQIQSHLIVTLQNQQRLVTLNGLQHQFIPARMAGMGEGRVGADIAECRECGRPWTTDVMRHRTSVHRGLREFICDDCREVQTAAVAARRGEDPG